MSSDKSSDHGINNADPNESVRALRALVANLNALREDEQRAMAEEIHDGLSQAMTVLHLELSIFRNVAPHTEDIDSRLSRAQRLVETLMESTRDLINKLRPPVLDDFGIVPALEWIASRFRATSSSECRVLIEPKEIDLPPETSSAIYRIVEEALTNAQRHSEARNVTISLTMDTGTIRLTVTDDGIGFQSQVPADPNQFGLMHIRERVAFLNGTFSVDAAPRRGTTLIVQLPCTSGGMP
ncbi:MAG: sensor histidine kinase [Spirochaetales bacterium]|nr:sensor histidine kinase [Spirochaetales bacterium]